MLCYLQIVHFVEGFSVCDVKTLLCKYSKKKCLSCSWLLSLSLCWSHLYNNKIVWNLLRKRLHGVSDWWVHEQGMPVIGSLSKWNKLWTEFSSFQMLEICGFSLSFCDFKSDTFGFWTAVSITKNMIIDHQLSDYLWP